MQYRNSVVAHFEPACRVTGGVHYIELEGHFGLQLQVAWQDCSVKTLGDVASSIGCIRAQIHAAVAMQYVYERCVPSTSAPLAPET